MFTLQNLVQPGTLDEAYNILMEKKSNTILGGCAFLRMGSKRIADAVDLSKLNLNYIKDNGDYIEIGAMATFRDIETNPVLKVLYNGIIPEAVGNIIGVQFRNIVTVGATVFSKYGFSDLITALLALDTEVELYNGGRLSLEEFLDKPYKKDILKRIFIKKDGRMASYQNIRNSASDYPILNAAVSCNNNKWSVVVGARPAVAKISKGASELLSKDNLTTEDIENAADAAVEELSFGSNMRGSLEYRKAICKVLVKRGIMEVLKCR